MKFAFPQSQLFHCLFGHYNLISTPFFPFVRRGIYGGILPSLSEQRVSIILPGHSLFFQTADFPPSGSRKR